MSNSSLNKATTNGQHAAHRDAQPPSMGALNSSNKCHKEQLLKKIGGREVLHKAVDEFYARLIEDDRLKHLFAGANLSVLKWHQYNIMSIAFSSVPDDFRVDDLILQKHKKMFENAGMNEKHYDIVLEHFEATLRDLNVEPQAIAEARAGVAGLRQVFAQGAQDAALRREKQIRNQRIVTYTVLGIATIAVARMIVNRRNRK